jgi:Rrf2 family protein
MSSVLKISEATSLALHSMAFLAAKPEQATTTKEIAARFNVSEAHLSKVLQRLTKAGFVESTRGPKGGFALSRPADEISLLDVYEFMEGPLTSRKCLLGTPVCRGNECILGGLLETVDRQLRDYLSKAKLSELADRVRE